MRQKIICEKNWEPLHFNFKINYWVMDKLPFTRWLLSAPRYDHRGTISHWHFDDSTAISKDLSASRYQYVEQRYRYGEQREYWPKKLQPVDFEGHDQNPPPNLHVCIHTVPFLNACHLLLHLIFVRWSQVRSKLKDSTEQRRKAHNLRLCWLVHMS